MAGENLYLKSPFSVSLFGLYRSANPALWNLFFYMARIGQLTSFEPIKKLTPPQYELKFFNTCCFKKGNNKTTAPKIHTQGLPLSG